MRRVLVGVWCLLMMAGVAAAQGTRAEDHASTQLGFFTGRWTLDGQSRPTPAAALGHVSGDHTCSWFSGGPTVVCRESTKDQQGEMDILYILAWDAGKKVYTYYGTDSAGTITSAQGTLEGDTWRFTGESRAGGVTTPMRMTFRPAGSAAHTRDVEVSNGKGVWTKTETVTFKHATR